MMTDRVADLLTRVRNAQQAGLEKIEMPTSNLLYSISEILKAEGFISGVKSFNIKGKRHMRLTLKYDDGRAVIREISRVSKPGRRVYVSADKVPRVKSGFGIAIVSTSKGIMTDVNARKSHVGGEVLCQVF